MKIQYESENYEIWTMVNDITFDRKLEYETAFDGVVKVYSLKTNKENLNDLLIGKYFGSFIHNAEQGVFLRMFKSKKSWPKTRLVYLNFKTEKLRVIKKTRSSYDIWKGTDLGNGRHSIEIKPTEKIKHQI